MSITNMSIIYVHKSIIYTCPSYMPNLNSSLSWLIAWYVSWYHDVYLLYIYVIYNVHHKHVHHIYMSSIYMSIINVSVIYNVHHKHAKHKFISLTPYLMAVCNALWMIDLCWRRCRFQLFVPSANIAWSIDCKKTCFCQFCWERQKMVMGPVQSVVQKFKVWCKSPDYLLCLHTINVWSLMKGSEFKPKSNSR